MIAVRLFRGAQRRDEPEIPQGEIILGLVVFSLIIFGLGGAVGLAD
jgi:hypothetical protein